MTKHRQRFAGGERLETFAIQRFGSQKKLSVETGISTSQLSLYCSDTQSPGFVPLKQFYDTGLSIDWLFADPDELHLFSMDRPRKGVRLGRKRAVEDMTTLELVEELARRLQEEAK